MIKSGMKTKKVTMGKVGHLGKTASKTTKSAGPKVSSSKVHKKTVMKKSAMIKKSK